MIVLIMLMGYLIVVGAIQPYNKGIHGKVSTISNIKGKTRKMKRPPTIQEITDYCKERGNSIDPVYFFHHYDAIGWVRGSGKTVIPIVKWKSVIIQWEQRTTHPAAIKKRDQRYVQEKKEQFVPKKKVKVNPESKKLVSKLMKLGRDWLRASRSDRIVIKKKIVQLRKEIQKVNDHDLRIGRILE